MRGKGRCGMICHAAGDDVMMNDELEVGTGVRAFPHPRPTVPENLLNTDIRKWLDAGYFHRLEASSLLVSS
jgi:hypothetical protein